jgi:hypothetical protein
MMDVECLGKNAAVWKGIDDCSDLPLYAKSVWATVIENSFKHSPRHILGFKNANILDVLPVFSVRMPFLGEKLVSVPYDACYGGFSSGQSEVRQHMVDELVAYAKKKRVKYIEIRSLSEVSELSSFGFCQTNPFVTSVVPLRHCTENWSMLSKKHRRNVKAAAKKGVVIELASNWSEVKAFYDLLVDHYNGIGTPFLGVLFFKEIWEHIIQKNQGALLLAKFEERIIGGHLLLYSGDTLISKYSTTRRNGIYSKLYSSYALFWEAINFGCAKEFQNFNLGITGRSNSGLLEFKSRFGAATREVNFYYYLLRGKVPEYEQYYSSYAFLKALWSKLPKILTSTLGHKINGWIC